MKMKLFKILKLLNHRETGVTLVETLVAVAILGITAVSIFTGFNTNSRIIVTIDERETAKNLAENQMEYIKDQVYAASYEPAPIPGEYAGYSANITVSTITSRDGNIQKVTVIIEHHDREVIRLEGYKVN